MKYDDLEKTQELFLINDDVPTPIEDIEKEGVSKNNVTDQLDSEEKKDVQKKKEKKNKDKVSLKDKWNKLPKNKKIIIIVSGVVLLILLIGLCIFLVLGGKNDSESKKEKKPEVVIEKENYIYKDGKLSLLDENEQEIGVYECNNKDEKLCYVANYSGEDKFDGDRSEDEDGNLLEKRSAIYNNNYVFIFDNKKENEENLILYNIKEKKSEGNYNLVKGFSDSNYVIVKDNNKYGALEIGDSIVEKIKPTFDYLGRISKDSKLVAKTGDKYFIYDLDGKVESKGIGYEIRSYNDKFISAYNDSYYLYDKEGELVFVDGYDFIDLDEDYMGLIKDNSLYIRDYDKQKYNEEGIKLNNKYYNKTSIYSKDKVLKETKQSYKIEVVEDNIEVTYYDKNNKEKAVSLAVYEGKFSSNLANLNYLDGKLYFYSDEDKNILVGSYTCNNKNKMDKDTTTFSNCLVASDSFYSKNTNEADNSGSLGWIPVFNERYVFVVDSIDINNPTIILYDLKENKVLSKYESVDTGSYTGEAKVTFKATDATYVMAKNKNNKYGVINIGQEVKSAIPFNYAEIERLKNYFVAKSASGTYVLLDNTGKEISDKYGYKILDYSGKYIAVQDGNKYAIYDFSGDRIDHTSYLYVTLHDDFYSVVTTDKYIDLRKYDDATFSLSDPIDISDVKDYKNAYSVTKAGDGYVIDVQGKVYDISASGDTLD